MLLIAIPLAIDKSSRGSPIMLVVRKRNGYMAILAMIPPTAPNIETLTNFSFFITEISLQSKCALRYIR